MLCLLVMNALLTLLGLEPKPEEPPQCLKALNVLNADSLPDARKRAHRVLTKAQRCPCCSTLLGHVYDRLGSTLFIDDDPRALVSAFDATDRDPFSQQVLAALIVLRGRPRTRPQYA